MEINSDVLKHLKCCICKGYLSCGPIYILPNGDNICGRCRAPEHKSRNKPYEHLAQQLKFPCIYKPNGCLITTLFHLQKNHELTCKYRHSTCLVSEPGTCNWIGPIFNILNHCKKNHSDTITQNSLTLTHDITKTNDRRFVIEAYDTLFLIYAKICLNSGNIYYRVHSLFNSEQEYNFNITINNNFKKFTRSCKISPLQLSVHENDLALRIKSVLKIFGGLEITSFNITINQVSCATGLKACKFSGCVYKDTANAVAKHQMFFCEFSKWCYLCNGNISKSRLLHFYNQHSDVHVRRVVGEPFWECATAQDKTLLFGSPMGLLHCTLILNDAGFLFMVRTPLSSDQLRFYMCMLELFNYSTSKWDTPVFNIVSGDGIDFNGDWELSIDRNTFITTYVRKNDNTFNLKLFLEPAH